jgi:predicted ribosomally synthesized peptide with SipW-like signal peptide
MKNIFLSVVIICALTIAGIGGTLASLTDTEESLDNKIEVASLDLKVNDMDDAGADGIGAVIVQECILPGTPMKTVVKVENEGCADGYLYLIFKHLDCYNVLKEGAEGWIEDTNIVGDPALICKMKPEPEIVAEYGGWLAQKEIDGIGRTGDNCCMTSHTYVTAWYGTPAPTLQPAFLRPDPIIDNAVIGDLDNCLTYLGVLPLCGGDWFIEFNFDVPQESEGMHNYFYFNDASPFDHWPANALQADGITFDILFILVDHQLTPAEMAAIYGDLV